MKLWGGRFAGKTDPQFESFSESFSIDQRLVLYDLRVNQAYVNELAKARILTSAEARRLVGGLEKVRRHIVGHPHWANVQKSEDVHTWVEAQLEKSVGTVARKLRTGRSRNDLVATETRLYVKEAVATIAAAALELMSVLVAQARRHLGVVMPGFTHLQPAQPILFSHYLLAYFEMLLRDVDRLRACRQRADELSLGCGALAGASFPLNRVRLARALGFARVARNSLDATSDRDFVCELMFSCALLMVHLSRLAEDLIIYSSPAFGYVELADAYSTGSSLMPQKKNPDLLELIRGKTGTTLGRLSGLLAVLKGLPLAYNRDLQEDKAALFAVVDTARESLILAARAVGTLKINQERMLGDTARGFLTATDLAEELVRRGISFAQAHEQVGRVVRAAEEAKKTLAELTSEEARRFIPAWDDKLRMVAVSPAAAVERRAAIGGTAGTQVTRQIASGERKVAQLRRELAKWK